MILEILATILPALLLILPCSIPLIYFRVKNQRWVPSQTRRSASIRRFESIAVLLGISVLGILWVYEGSPTSWVPKRFGDGVSAALRMYYFTAMIFGSALGLVCVILAWRVNTSIAITSLLISGLTGSMLLQQQISKQEQRQWALKYMARSAPKDAVPEELQPTRLRFEMIDNLAGADFWINGTYIGKTPYETTDRELFEKVRPWTKEDELKHRNSSAPEDNFKTPQGNSIGRWGWCPLHFLSIGRAQTQLYFRVDLNGKAGFSSMSSQRSMESPGNSAATQVVRFDTVFPEWEVAIEELLDHARLNHYDVDAAWFEAFQSFGMFGTNRLNQALRTEPGLKKIQARRAQLDYQLQDAHDPDSAWVSLMQIEERVRTTHEYDSVSPTGLAVDQLVPLLDVNQLIDHAIRLIQKTKNPDAFNISYGPDRFATYDNGARPYGDEIALWPIAQALWRFDQKFDAERNSTTDPLSIVEADGSQRNLLNAIDPDRDNPVERRLTPLIMRLSYPNQERLKYAEILGGSTYERFLLRNDWRSLPDRSGTSPHVGEFENRVNPWFYRLLWLRSPIAAAFRQQQSNAILTIAKNAMTDFTLNSGTFPQDLDFLFLDREFAPDHPSLAMQFWPQLDRLAASAPKYSQQQSLQLRWSYLARMWPESKPEMFIDALNVATVNSDRVISPQLPEDLSAEVRFEIYLAVLLSETASSAKLPDDPKEHLHNGPKQRSQQLLRELTEKIYSLPCESAARKLLQDLAADPKHSWWDRLSYFLAYNTQNDDLLRLMVEGGQAKLQLLVLPAIEHFPTDTRQELLAKLLTAKDESVRTAAAEVARKLKELGQRPYPHRKD
jgi:hypothetical protein